MEDLSIATLCKKQRDITKRGLSMQYQNTESAVSFYNGDAMTYKDRIQFEDTAGRRRRATVCFNEVQANVDAVTGFMAQNRRQAKYTAHRQMDEGQEIYSKNMNALYTYHRQNMNADQVETDQDADMLINGYGAIETDLSYIIGNSTTDPNGEIVKARIDPLHVGWDPKARAKNLLDARWVHYYEDYDLRDALKLFQGSKQEDFQRVDEENSDERGYVYNPWGGLYDKIKLLDTVEWTSKDEDMVRVYNQQWFEYETFYRAKNPVYEALTPEDAMFYRAKLEMIKSQIEPEGPDGIESRDMFEFDPLAEQLTFDEKTKGLLVKSFGDLIDPVDFKRKCFYTAVVSGDHVFTKFKSISQQGFSVKFKTGVYNATDNFWTGMVNAMMEPQKYYNKALTELLFTIAANSKGGVMVEEDAVEDIADFETKWAKTDAVISVRPGSLGAGKIQEKTRAALPTGLDNIITLSIAAISKAGVDPAFLGNINDNEQSGILFKRRIRQVISKMARYFDSITLYQKEDARLMADLIRVWVENNNGQWVRITGDQGAEKFVEVSEDMLAAEYDVSIQEAPQSPEDKQETASVLGLYADKLMPINPSAAQTFYAESIQMLPLDGDVKNRLIKVLQPQEDPRISELQQIIQQLQSQLTQIQVEKTKSEIDVNASKVREYVAKTQNINADTARILEEAANKGLENDIIRSGNYEKANVTI